MSREIEQSVSEIDKIGILSHGRQLARSHGLRGSVVRDAQRPSASAKKMTRSVEKGIPTGSMGTSFPGLNILQFTVIKYKT